MTDQEVEKMVKEELKKKKARAKKAQPVSMSHEKIITMALNNIKNSVKSCEMTGKVSFGKTKFPYANENDVIKALRQACVDNGIMIMPSYESHETDNKGNVVTVMDVKISHVSGAVWPYVIKTAGTCGQNNILGSQTSAMRVFYLKLFHMYTGDDPELITQAEGEQAQGKLNGITPKAGGMKSVMDWVMKAQPGATEEDRTKRLGLLNTLLAEKSMPPVKIHTQVTDTQWLELATHIKTKD